MPRGDVLDVSHWNKVTDGFKAAKAQGYVGVIAKASESLGSVDPKFKDYRKMAQDHGLLFGSYHFLRAKFAKGQADHYADQIGEAAGELMACDWEDTTVPMTTARTFCMRIQEHYNRLPRLYSYSSMLLLKVPAQSKADKLFWKGTKLWLAEYSATCHWPKDIWPSWWMHQFTGDGHGPTPHDVAGVGKKVDINEFNGTREQLIREWAL